jgi:hypothetical protein
MKSSHWCIRGKIKLTLTKNSKGKSKATNARIKKYGKAREVIKKTPSCKKSRK